jgi:hypothetical protein
MYVINLESISFGDHKTRRVKKIREVLLENVPVFEDAGWSFDATRFAIWLEGTRALVSTERESGEFFWVQNVVERESGTIDLSSPDSIVSVALACVEEELDAFYGEYDSEAEFAEELYASTGDVSRDFPLYFAIDWQKAWDSALRFDFDSQAVIDVDGEFKQYFWRNV